MLDGKNISAALDLNLAVFAQKNATSRGRKFVEKPDSERGPFQRDRDRIIHARSFRRLRGKMQVLPPTTGDHFRNRLSHTLEVSQIARDLARQLNLNEDLAEAVALAHDLGHPPFGHAGEMALNEKMQDFNKTFEHNAQSLRVVELFESRYSNFFGLNLSLETLEGIQKHETFFDRPNTKIFTPHLEAQTVDIADEIAYISADIDDGLRGGFFTIQDLLKLKIPAQAISELPLAEKENNSAVVRRIIKILLQEIIENTKNNLHKLKIKDLADVQQCKHKIVVFSPDFFQELKQLRDFLFQNFYSAEIVQKQTKEGQRIINLIFDFLLKNPSEIPEQKFYEPNIELRICDFIAGMTDEFARNFVIINL
jgi:dGTPase